MRIGISGLAVTAAAALGLSVMTLQPAAAAPRGVVVNRAHVAGVADELSSRRRHVRRYHYRSGNAAAARAFGAIAGTIGSIVAAEQARRYYQPYYYPYAYPYYAPYGYAPYGYYDPY